jgi:tetratricopeptide (TPR) repeat protein
MTSNGRSAEHDVPATTVVVRFAVVAICLACGLTACAGAPTQPDTGEATAPRSRAETFAAADEAYAKGNTELALRLYVEAADADPTDAESLFKIGAIYEERKEYALAARAYARAVQVDPAHARALEALGLRYFEDRQLEEARGFLSRAIAADPTRWKSHNALGLIADASTDYATAAVHYAAALAIRPDAASVLNNRGYSQYLAGDLAAAERDFRAALVADPQYPLAWHNLGLVYARKGQYDAALATLGRVVSNYVAANDVGYIAMLSGDFAKAEVLFDDAIRLSPRYYPTANDNVAELRRRRAGTNGEP